MDKGSLIQGSLGMYLCTVIFGLFMDLTGQFGRVFLYLFI